MKLKRFKERDHKRMGIVIFTLLCIFLVSGVILYRTFAIFEVKTNQNMIKGKVGDMGEIAVVRMTQKFIGIIKLGVLRF